MPKKNWKAELKKMTHTKGSDKLKMEITPFRDWRIIVAAFFIGLVFLVGFNVYMSIQINNDGFLSTSTKTPSVMKFNEKGLQDAIAIIDEKEALFEKIKNDGVTMVDPSL